MRSWQKMFQSLNNLGVQLYIFFFTCLKLSWIFDQQKNESILRTFFCIRFIDWFVLAPIHLQNLHYIYISKLKLILPSPRRDHTRCRSIPSCHGAILRCCPAWWDTSGLRLRRCRHRRCRQWTSRCRTWTERRNVDLKKRKTL